VNMNPTLRGGMNYERQINRKNRLKKNLNWLKRTTGTKVMKLYFVLSILLLRCDLGLLPLPVR
jgi:hypothetical protein